MHYHLANHTENFNIRKTGISADSTFQRHPALFCILKLAARLLFSSKIDLNQHFY